LGPEPHNLVVHGTTLLRLGCPVTVSARGFAVHGSRRPEIPSAAKVLTGCRSVGLVDGPELRPASLGVSNGRSA